MSEGKKRRMSSDGQTPKPTSKMLDKMNLKAESVKDLQTGQKE